MKYKCTDCGKIYTDKVEFCECGNDTFKKLLSESERNNGAQKVVYTPTKPEKKENPIFLILFIIFLCFLFYFIVQKIMHYQTTSNDGRQEYIDKIQKSFFSEFDPKGIEKSGYCVVSFVLDSNGGLHNKKFIKASKVPELDTKVNDLLTDIKSFGTPPASCTNVPINFEFGCMVNGAEVECYNKPFRE